jgi:hypothetical protein
VSIVFRLEQIGSADLAATTDLGTKLGQVSLLLVFRKEPRLFLKKTSKKWREKGKNRRKKDRDDESREKRNGVLYLVIETRVGTEHHSATRQTFFHSSLVSFLFGNLEKLKAMRAFDLSIRTIDLVASKILAENRGFTILTVGDIELALLRKERTVDGKEYKGMKKGGPRDA